MKRKQWIIIAVLAVILVGALAAWRSLQNELLDEPDLSEEPLDTGILVAPLEGEVTHVQILWKNGRTLSYRVGVDGDGEELYTVEGDDSSLGWNQYRLGVTVKVGMTMTADGVVEQPESDLALYGLLEPEVTITYTSGTGDQLALFLGDSTAATDSSNNFVYLKNDREDTIFLENALNVRYLGRTIEEYREVTLLPDSWVWRDNINAVIDTMERIEIEQHGDLVLRLRRGTMEELDGRPLGNAPFVFDYPGFAYTNPEVLYGRFIGPLLTATRGSTLVNESVSPEELSRYLLDEPYAAVTIDDGEAAYRFLFGWEPGWSSYYIMREDLPAVVSALEMNVQLDFNVMDLVHPSFWSYPPEEIRAVSIQLAGREYLLEYMPDDAATLNGAILEPDVGDAILEAVLGINYEGLTEEIPEGEPDCLITITLASGARHTLEFAKYNARQCAVRFDGVRTGFYCRAAYLDELALMLESSFS